MSDNVEKFTKEILEEAIRRCGIFGNPSSARRVSTSDILIQMSNWSGIPQKDIAERMARDSSFTKAVESLRNRCNLAASAGTYPTKTKAPTLKDLGELHKCEHPKCNVLSIERYCRRHRRTGVAAGMSA